MSSSKAHPRVLLTAGPTREYLDDVRYFSNASTGRMGAAIAAACETRRWKLAAVCGPLETPLDNKARVVPVVSAAEMFAEVKARFADCDVFIAAAAVADYAPRARIDGKLKKTADVLNVELVRTPDILAWAGANRHPGQVIVGFALESDPDLVLARKKLLDKKCDLIVHNTPKNFGAGGGRVTIVSKSGIAWEGEPDKPALAGHILDLAGTLLNGGKLACLRAW